MKKGLLLIMGVALIITATSCKPQKPAIDVAKYADKNCMCCIEDALKPNRFIAALDSFSNKAKTMRLKVNSSSALVKVDENTKYEGVKDNTPSTILKQTCMIVDVKKVGDNYVATSIKVLPPLADRIKDSIVITEYIEKKINTIPPKIEGFVLIDSRPEFAYNGGTIPGAINITYPQLQEADKKKEVEKLLGADKNKEIIFFCGGLHCNLAPGSAIVAKKNGYKNIKVYHLGLPEWRKSGHPVCLKQKGLKVMQKKGICMIIVDLRKDAAKEHIAGAIGIQPNEVNKWKSRFPISSNPVNKMAPIIVYVQNNKYKGDVSPVLKTIFSWGFRNVSILDEGFDGYKKNGGKVESNKLLNKINYVKNLEPGEIYVRDFVNKVKKLGDMEVIVDARPTDEFDANHIPGAKNVPVAEFTKAQADELKTYKQVYLYCNTGLLAGLLYEKTNQFGLKNVKWVKTNVIFDGGKINIGTHEKFSIPNVKKKAE